jgi:hypothetical protein
MRTDSSVLIAAADFPFGAVIVRDGAVMARGRNLGRTNQDPTAHGEMDAIRKCVAEHGPATLRMMQPARFASQWAIAGRVAVHATPRGQHLAGFREQSRRPCCCVADSRKTFWRR